MGSLFHPRPGFDDEDGGGLGKTSDAAWFRDLHAARRDFFNKTYIEPEAGNDILRFHP